MSVIKQYTVKISGIKSCPDLNGEIVKLTGESTGLGRYSVQLKNGSKISLKWSLLELVNPNKKELNEGRSPCPMEGVAGLEITAGHRS